MDHSIIERISFEQFKKLEQEKQDSRIWLRLAEAMRTQHFLESQRIAQREKRKSGPREWKFVLIERYGRKEVWVIFRPEDVERAREFHSHKYFREALESGETVLAAFDHCSWNVLCSTDKILAEITSTRKQSVFEIENRGKDAAKRFGV